MFNTKVYRLNDVTIVCSISLHQWQEHIFHPAEQGIHDKQGGYDYYLWNTYGDAHTTLFMNMMSPNSHQHYHTELIKGTLI